MNNIKTAKALVDALNSTPPHLAMPVVDEFLVQNISDGPPVSLYLINGDAKLWAETCTPTEARQYFIELIKRLQSQPMGLAAKKRLFFEIWQTLPVADQRSFLGRVTAPASGVAA